MPRRDILSDLADIVLPLPAHPGNNAGELELEAWSHGSEQIANERQVFRDNLENAWDAGAIDDPLLSALASTRHDMLAAEKRLRLLIAYGREFVEPRPYRLEDLAQAAGMSISGVRTAYADDEVVEVARRIRAALDRRPASRS